MRMPAVGIAVFTAVAAATWAPLCYAPPPMPADGPPAEEEDPGLRIDPHYRAGQRWTTAYDLRWEITHAESNGMQMPADQVMGIRGGQGMWVLEADPDGQYRMVVFEFDKCVSYKGGREQERPTETPLPHSNEEYVLVRDVSMVTDTPRHRITPEQKELLEILPAALAMPSLPDGPVEVGDQWTAEDITGLFGPSVTGEMTMKLVRVLKGEDGRQKAVLAVTGGKAVAPAGEGGTVTTTFEGNLRIDLPSRVLDRTELAGTSEMSMKMGTFSTRQWGPWSMTQKARFFPPRQPTPQEIEDLAGLDPPPGERDD